ncbi:MAG: glycosyl hydrolase family 18 protein [Turicibacter sp.]|nr:glycosyl hydrolase family 18 protein [Turicibacter sp.]
MSNPRARQKPENGKNGKKGKKNLPLRILIIVVIVGSILFGGWESRRFFPYHSSFAWLGLENWQVWEFHDYFGLDPEDLSVVLNGERLRNMADLPHFLNGEIILPVEFVREFIDPFIFWDEETLFITTDTELLLLTTPYVTADFVNGRDIWRADVEFRPEFNTLVVVTEAETRGRVLRPTEIRYRPENTAFITKRASAGDRLAIFETAGDFVRVRTEEGLLGYAELADIDNNFYVVGEVEEIAAAARVEPIVLAWEMITAPIGNNTMMNVPLPEVLTVISPTWFNIDTDAMDGRLTSFGSAEYVAWAHGQGAEVWPNVFDGNSTTSRIVLANFESRGRAIGNLLDSVAAYNLDGIVINFEHVPVAYSWHYLQFLRELAIEMRRIDRVLATATFVPSIDHVHYNHELMGQTVDFVAIMTYDEHWAGSPAPGPVASLPFVDRFIAAAAELIPRERVIMGIPLYNRLWRVAADGSHTSTLHGMGYPLALLEERGVEVVWDAVAGYNYANFEGDEEGFVYRIWVEDEMSVAAKMGVFREHDVGGVAFWRRGLEIEGVWGVVEEGLVGR